MDILLLDNHVIFAIAACVNMLLILATVRARKFLHWGNVNPPTTSTVYVLIQAHALIDAHAPAAQNTSHQIHDKYLIKHQKIVQKD